MDKAKAKQLLTGLIESGRKITPTDDEQRKRWQLDTTAVLERVFGSPSRQLTDFGNVHWWPMVFSMDGDNSRAVHRAAHDGLNQSLAILGSALNEVEQFWELDQAGESTDPFKFVERLCNRFHSVARQLRARHGNNRPTLEVDDEYDVQYLLHALLLLDFDDVRAEEWTPSYAGASARMDFLLKREQIVLEAKRTRKGLAAKEIGEQLIVDSQRYKGHPDCKLLVCFVYDPEGIVANPRGVENDLAKAGGDMPVKVYIRP